MSRTPVGGQSGLPAIGTQGQLWMVLYSNGFPAAVFFVGFFAAVLWQTRRARGMAGLWLHTVPLVALPQIVVYGWLPVELAGRDGRRCAFLPLLLATRHASPVRARVGRPE